MRNVRHILKQKGNTIYSVKPGLTVYEAIREMGVHNIGSVLVMENDELLGILTERDYARKVVLKGKFSADTYVHEIMTPHPGLSTVTPETSIEACMDIITKRKVRHLPVMENGKLIGVISIGDVVFTYIDQQQDIIEGMTSYIYSK